MNWAVCNFGNCVLKRSLNATEEIEIDNLKEACFDAYVVKDSETGKLYCSGGPYLNRSHVCSSLNHKCSYFRLSNDVGTRKSWTEQADCSCGESYTGKAYCPFK